MSFSEIQYLHIPEGGHDDGTVFYCNDYRQLLRQRSGMFFCAPDFYFGHCLCSGSVHFHFPPFPGGLQIAGVTGSALYGKRLRRSVTAFL